MRLRHALFPILLLAAVRILPAAEKLPPASQWIPADAVVEVEVSRPVAVLDVALDPELLKSISGLPAYQKMAADPKFRQFLGLVHYLENQLQTDWADGARKLTGGGVTAAFGPKGEAIVSDRCGRPRHARKAVPDPARLRRQSGCEEVRGRKRGPNIAASRCGPATAWLLPWWTIDFSLANRLDVLKAALDLRAGTGGAWWRFPPIKRRRRPSVQAPWPPRTWTWRSSGRTPGFGTDSRTTTRSGHSCCSV